MKVVKFILILLTITSLFILTGCGTSKIATFTSDEYALSDDSKRAQTISNVKIEVEPLSLSKIYDHPELFTFDYALLPDDFLLRYDADAMFPKDIKGKRWCYTLGQGRFMLTAMKVKISNNTPHILRMKDARIYLVEEGKDPVAAMTKLGNTQLYSIGEKTKIYRPKSAIDADGSLVHWITYFENEYEKERPKSWGPLSVDFPIGLGSQVIAQHKREYMLINDVSREILPDFSYSGILVFPTIVSAQNAKLIFYDITTKTDAAGNPIEKAKFEFPLKLKTVDLWYNKAEKKWKVGVPPTTAAK